MSHAMMWTVFLFIFLDLTHFSHAQVFWTHHVDYPKTKILGNPSRYCDLMMVHKGLINSSYCMHFNTFIHEANDTILNICANSVIHYHNSNRRNCYISPHPILVTDCFVRCHSCRPYCRYVDLVHFTKIGVICVNGQPEHMIRQIYSPPFWIKYSEPFQYYTYP